MRLRRIKADGKAQRLDRPIEMGRSNYTYFGACDCDKVDVD